ncbi:MAG: hypothetical protein LC754_07660 [Acidobacteria bacterium]|nr:hypothetical protein [Acidobacteriota bacterium]
MSKEKPESKAVEASRSNELLGGVLDGVVVFAYKGGIYNRPCRRGICFREPDGELSDAQLEDKIPEGDFEMEIIVRKKKAV